MLGILTTKAGRACPNIEEYKQITPPTCKKANRTNPSHAGTHAEPNPPNPSLFLVSQIPNSCFAQSRGANGLAGVRLLRGRAAADGRRLPAGPPRSTLLAYKRQSACGLCVLRAYLYRYHTCGNVRRKRCRIYDVMHAWQALCANCFARPAAVFMSCRGVQEDIKTFASVAR